MNALAKATHTSDRHNAEVLISLAALKQDEAVLLRMLPKIAQQPRAMRVAFAAAVYELDKKTSSLQNALSQNYFIQQKDRLAS